MRRKRLTYSYKIIVISLIIWMPPAVADPNLKIIFPKNGAVFQEGESIPVQYEIKPNPGGDHSHIYINNKEAGILRRKKATFTLNPLPVGKHSICLKVVNKAHTPIGQETCIKITRL